MKKLIFIVAYLFLTVLCTARVITVDDDAPAEFDNIQAAIDEANDGDLIFVFPGTYTGPGNYNIEFDKAVTVRSLAPAYPDIVAQTIVDCNGLGNGFNFQGDVDANSILSGLTIKNGVHVGGAILCAPGTSPKILNCVLTGANTFEGGGIFCESESSPAIKYCTISDNRGSGIFCDSRSTPKITECTIIGNFGYGKGCEGGGIYCEYDSGATITNCIISANTSWRDGGGIYIDYSYEFPPTITGCIITGNSTTRYGGGIYCAGESRPKITDCTIADNYAGDRGGGIWCHDSNPVISNNIIWGNTDNSGSVQSAQIFDDEPEPEIWNVWFSCIQDENPDDANIPYGEEQFNIDDDPCFVDPGSWVDVNDPNIVVEPNDPNAVWLDGDYHLLFESPCVETGDPSPSYEGEVDIDRQPRLMGQCVDRGSDEFEISMIVVTKPQGGEVWTAGSTHEIKWNSSNITGNVDIYYTEKGSAEVLTVGSDIPDTGSFTWNIPSSLDSNQCVLTVAPNTPVTNLVCIPSGLFTIHPDSLGLPIPSKWRSLGGDFDRNGLSQDIGPELGCIKWQFQTDGPVSASPSVGVPGFRYKVGAARIHLPCEDGKLYTIDGNGQLLWTYDANSPLLSSPSIGPDGSVFVGAQNGKLYAIGVNGDLRWTHSTDGFIYSSPAVAADGNVFVCSQDGTLYALGQDGSELWAFETGGVGVVSGAVFASPAIGPNDTILISGLYDHNLYALDANDGSVKWTCSFFDPCEPNGTQPWPFASPVVAPDGTIYQTLLYNPKRLIDEEEQEDGYWYDSRLYAIDSNNGNIIWSTNMTETPTQIEEVNPILPEPNYWFKKYYHLKPGEQPYPAYPFTQTLIGGINVLRYYRVSNFGWSEPALAPDGTIYVSFDDQYLRAVEPNGTIKWVTSLGWFGSFNLTVSNDGLIYAAGDDGRLCVVDPDGKEVARFESGDGLSFPIVTYNTVIVCDANNTVWAIGSDDCEGQAAALHRPEDLNADWSMNFVDFALMANTWLECTDTSYNLVTEEPYCNDDDNEIFLAGDINRDQYVNAADLADLANRWLEGE